MNGLKEKYPTMASTMAVIIFFPSTAREIMFIMKKEEQEHAEGSKKVWGDMVEIKMKGTVGSVNQAVREDGNPQSKRNISDTPEGMKHIFPGHELSEKQHDKAFHHTALETIP